MTRPLLVCLCAAALAQDVPPPAFRLPEAATPAPENLDFEAPENNLPASWSLDQNSRVDGYNLEQRSEGCHGGSGCAVLAAGPQVKKQQVGVMIQQFDAEDFQGKHMRLRAWVKLEDADSGGRIKIAFTSDGENAEASFVQKGSGTRSPEWTLTEVDGKVPMRAETLHIAISMLGRGKAWVDDITFEELK